MRIMSIDPIVNKLTEQWKNINNNIPSDDEVEKFKTYVKWYINSQPKSSPDEIEADDDLKLTIINAYPKEVDKFYNALETQPSQNV
jgi:hypothetical protein